MYWFPRYNVSFRQNFCGRKAQGHAADRGPGQGHLSNSDEDGGVARRRVPRRTSSEIASAKIAGRSGKVRGNGTFHTRVQSNRGDPRVISVPKDVRKDRLSSVRVLA